MIGKQIEVQIYDINVHIPAGTMRKPITQTNLGLSPDPQQSQSTDTGVVVKKSTAFIAGCQAQRIGSLELLSGFQEKFFKDSVRQRVTDLWMVRNREMLWETQSSTFLF